MISAAHKLYLKKWFRDQNIDCKAGIAPTVEDSVGALKSHDLFIYILAMEVGYNIFPDIETQKLENRAATLLMGCRVDHCLQMGNTLHRVLIFPIYQLVSLL